ncbi:MAG: hypothetical protein ACR2H0_01035 [Candidatus Limnocylindrales bacterium]
MSTGTLPAEQLVRHSADGLPVIDSMTRFHAAVPSVRALILAVVVTALIMVGLPAVLAIASAATV